MKDANQADSKTFAVAGFRTGCLVAVLVWFVPLPVALVVWLFQLKGLFADYMYMAIPFLVALPLVGGFIGSFIVRSDGRQG
jgi:hypothetical protein